MAVSFTATIGSPSAPAAAICRSRSTPVVVSSHRPDPRAQLRPPLERLHQVAAVVEHQRGPVSSAAARCRAYSSRVRRPCRACTPTPPRTSAAATSSWVDSGLEAARCSSAPPRTSVRASAAVSGVTCMQAATRTPASGRSAAEPLAQQPQHRHRPLGELGAPPARSASPRSATSDGTGTGGHPADARTRVDGRPLGSRRRPTAVRGGAP